MNISGILLMNSNSFPLQSLPQAHTKALATPQPVSLRRHQTFQRAKLLTAFNSSMSKPVSVRQHLIVFCLLKPKNLSDYRQIEPLRTKRSAKTLIINSL